MSTSKFKIDELIENRYRVLDAIETGGMGTLYQVADEAKDGQIVALKTVKLDVSGIDPVENEQRLQREFRILTELHHPNLVAVHDYGITPGEILYFTMEWIEGHALDLDRGTFSLEETLPIVVQICRALAYLHARGVIHGDLKPANVLLLDGQVKIVDFGISLEVRSPESRIRYYTPGYSAPEMKELRTVDHRVDLYSLGALWYALLVGEPPLFMLGADRLVEFALQEALEDQPNAAATSAATSAAAIIDVIARLLRTDPNERYASANQVIEAINQATQSAYQLETEETASSYALRARFVNREAEMTTLHQTWQRAQTGKRHIVLIEGESGVGKTRLVEELEIQAETGGARAVWGQCIESGGTAYHPWREVLRVLVRYVEDADESTLRRVGPVLATLLPELWNRAYMENAAPPAELDLQAAQRRLNAAIAHVLQAAANARPTLILLEDVHWADEATLELLQYLARIPGPERLLICTTYNSKAERSAQTLEHLTGDLIQRIALPPLAPEHVTDLIRWMLGLETPSPLLIERVQRTASGNAFFVQELIRSMAAEGTVLQRTVGGWYVDLEALQDAELPDSIRQVVWQRLAQLSEDTQKLLQWAAVVGPVFWKSAIGAIGIATRPQIEIALSEGQKQDLIVHRDQSTFEGEREFLFNSAVIQEVAYERVAPEKRRPYHDRVAAWLLTHPDAEIEEHLGLIAHHLEQAGRIEQAIDYLTRAGQQAAGQFANAEALVYYSRALDLLKPLDRPEKQEKAYTLLLARETIYDIQAAREAQAQDLEAMEELAEILNDDARRIETALQKANHADMTGDYPAAIASARAAADLAQTIGDTNQKAAAHMQWGGTLWRQSAYEAAQRQLEQALELAQSAGARQAEASSLRFLGLVAWNMGKHTDAQAYFERALPIYREIGDRRNEAGTFNNLGLIALEQGDQAQGEINYRQALAIFQEIGERRGEALVLSNLGVEHDQLGDYAQAKSYYEQALQVMQEIDDRVGESMALANLSLLLHNNGEDETALTHSHHALEVAQDLGDRRWQGYALTNMGHALEGLGRIAEAANAYREARDMRNESGEKKTALESTAGIARTLLAQDDPTRALTYVEEILEHLETDTLDGADEPFRIYLTCYQALQANQDPRAQPILDEAYHTLQERAAKIDDDALRRSFLENVTFNRKLVQAWKNKGT
ncbi:MAG TPA: tetratricopeptide repeat protein [Chloroflexi bacterium]|nr:tetratricopeptide repeat protein [Chloroflexota bacterium]